MLDPTTQPLTTKELALLLGMHVRTLILWRQHGRGPRYVRLSAQPGEPPRASGKRGIRYLQSDVNEWLESCRGRLPEKELPAGAELAK